MSDRIQYVTPPLGAYAEATQPQSSSQSLFPILLGGVIGYWITKKPSGAAIGAAVAYFVAGRVDQKVNNVVQQQALPPTAEESGRKSVSPSNPLRVIKGGAASESASPTRKSKLGAAPPPPPPSPPVEVLEPEERDVNRGRKVSLRESAQEDEEDADFMEELEMEDEGDDGFVN